jgi:hypothetical protein
LKKRTADTPENRITQVLYSQAAFRER